MKIAIVGAGLAGLCAAKALLDARAGEIAVFDSREGPGLETSHANGALLHPSAVDPWNSPGIFGVLWRSLGDPQATVRVRPSALPSLLGWGWRFVRESAPARYRAHTLANVSLALHSVSLMREWRDEGIEYGAYQRGTLMTFRDTASLAKAHAWSEMLAGHGVRWRALSRDEMVALEPALAPAAHALAGAVHNLSDEAGDAYRFCTAVTAQLAARGVHFRWSCGVAALQADRSRTAVHGLTLADGSSERFDAVVLAAASWSNALAAPLGLKLPVRPAKGYSVTMALPEAGPQPRTPVVDNALHIAVVPVVGGRLRVVGTAEFCGFDRTIDPLRISTLLRQLQQVYPALAEHVASTPAQPWAGLRPLCADGKPLIGATRLRGLFLSTGHGQLGWTTGAASGHLLACLMTARAPAVDAAPFAPARFGL